MSLTERLSEYVRACFTGLWIESHEHQDAITEIANLCREENWPLAVWNIHRGLQISGHTSEEQSGSDPLAAISAINALATPDGAAILVLENFHRFLQSAEIVQALSEQILAGKQNRTVIVVLSPVVNIPVELEKLFVVLEHELPGREQLEDIARGIATEAGELPEEGLEVVLDAAAGLTRYEAENAFSLSLVRNGAVQPQAVWELKTQTLKKSGLLSLYRGGETFADLGGLDALKQFCLKALRRSPNRHPEAMPKGILLLSPPGCGKTSLAKALGNEMNRPTIILDVGSLMSGLVGSTEQNTRRALATIDAMGSSVVLIDEVEKALAGVQAGAHDSGVSARMFGSILSWMSDGRRSDSFLVLTSNDVSKLPPEFLRSERLDGTFFLDLPGRTEKDIIWQMYLERFGLDADQPRPKDDLWTGAEIRSCCRLAALLNVSLTEAATNIVPVAVTASESVERLRTWASGRCLSADRPGLYQSSKTKSGSRRNISRDPSQN